MSVRSIDVDLLEHVELDPKPVGKLLDLTVGAGLLGTKLVAGEGEDGQLILCLVVFVEQLYQLRIVDLGLASSGGHVHNHTDLARVLAQVHLVPVNVSGRELIDVLLALG